MSNFEVKGNGVNSKNLGKVNYLLKMWLFINGVVMEINVMLMMSF